MARNGFCSLDICLGYHLMSIIMHSLVADAAAVAAISFPEITPAVHFLTQAFCNVLYVHVGKLIVHLWRLQHS